MATRTYKITHPDGREEWVVKAKKGRPRNKPTLAILIEEITQQDENGLTKGEVQRRGGWKQVIQNDLCAFCGKGKGTVDHITPKSEMNRLGITCDWDDYTGACQRCNGKKGASHFLIFFMVQNRNEFRSRTYREQNAHVLRRLDVRPAIC